MSLSGFSFSPRRPGLEEPCVASGGTGPVRSSARMRDKRVAHHLGDAKMRSAATWFLLESGRGWRGAYSREGRCRNRPVSEGIKCSHSGLGEPGSSKFGHAAAILSAELRRKADATMDARERSESRIYSIVKSIYPP